MSETIELPKPKRVYKKKVVSTLEQVIEPVAITPIPEPVAITPIPEPVAILDPPVLTRETNEPTPIKEKKPRSAKQIEAFNRMREAKQKKKQELQTPIPDPIPEPNPILPRVVGAESIKPKKTYKKKEPQQVYIDARTIHTPNPDSYNEPPIYTPQIQQKIQEKTYRPYIFV